MKHLPSAETSSGLNLGNEAQNHSEGVSVRPDGLCAEKDNMDRGFVIMWRKIEDWDWIDDPKTFWFFMRLIMMANWKDKQWKGITVKRGQIITSISNLSHKLKISQRSTRTLLTRLKSTSEIAIETTSHYSIITLIKYEAYQNRETISTRQTTDQPSLDRQTTDKRPTTTKQSKQLNNKTLTTVASIKTSDSLKDYLQIFRSAYKQATGKEYATQWGRDLKILKTAGATLMGSEDFAGLCAKFFAPNHAYKGNCDVPSFAKAINRLQTTEVKNEQSVAVEWARSRGIIGSSPCEGVDSLGGLLPEPKAE